MQMPGKVYDVLKWICLVALPALSTFYVALAAALNLPYADEVAKVTTALCTLIGALIGVSSAQYYKDKR